MQAIKTISNKLICAIFLLMLCNISTADSIPGYAIITTSEIKNTSQKLPEFMTRKESAGFNVQVVTETDFGGGVGNEAAENIRAWLQNNYKSDNIKYVLFIGNLDPNVGEIPMKWLWADEGKLAASDFYFAELTGNWDLDGDGIAGEWGDDFGWRDVDRQAEVLVGRIPYYGDVVEVDKILHNTILYETSTSQEWRKSALLAMTNNGWVLGETIKDNILGPAGWSWHRVYQENYGLVPPPETIPCSQETICRVWSGQAQNSGGKFGLAVWAGEHGHAMVTSECDFNSDFPSFTFQPPCTEGGVTLRENLAYKLLRSGGAICTVAATLGTKYTGTMFVGNSNSMAFEYTSRLVAGLSAGEALYDLKRVMRLPGDMYWRNWVVFNIYGDPSLKLVSPTGRTIFVDTNANGMNDGSSWLNAYRFLQDALAIALPGDEIRVAQGTYKPDQGIGIITGDRNASFHLKNGVELKGGFAGICSLDPNLRDIELFKTILSGDLDGNDVDVNELTKEENSCHVVTAPSGICRETILDGVTITGGYADGENPKGGGMYIDGGHPKVYNCIFKGNYAENRGGGIYNEHGGVILRGCVFESNSARYGGGIMNREANPTMVNCVFSGNSALWGAAMESEWSTSSLKNCTIYKNVAFQNGGGIFCQDVSSPRLTNCILWDNTPDQIKGDAIVTYSNILGGWEGQGNIDEEPLFAKPDYWVNVNDPNIVVDPADPNAIWSNGDYHLKSEAGRWNPNTQTWVTDDVTSPCIDAGDPNMLVGNEPFPSGIRINMGAYGGTTEASKSISNIREVVNVNDSDNGSQVTLKQGQILAVTLESNPTTGYSWFRNEKQGSIFEKFGDTLYFPSEHDDETVGAGGWEILYFRSINIGRETLELFYCRSWETDVEPVKTFSIDLVVN